VTQLRKKMLEELQRRNYSQATVRAYLLAVRQFAAFFHRSPDQLGPDHIRRFQSYLLQEKKLSPRSVVQRVSALRFLFVKTSPRPYQPGTDTRSGRRMPPSALAILANCPSPEPQSRFNTHRPRVRRKRQRLRSNAPIESAPAQNFSPVRGLIHRGTSD